MDINERTTKAAEILAAGIMRMRKREMKESKKDRMIPPQTLDFSGVLSMNGDQRS